MPIPTVPLEGELINTPDPYYRLSKFAVRRNARKGRVELQTSADGGKTYKVLLPEPGPKAQVGSSLILDAELNATWGQPAAASTPGSPDSAVDAFPLTYVEMPLYGALSTNRIFGFYVSPTGRAVQCIGTQVLIQSAPQGQSLLLDLVNGSGVEQGRFTTIAAGQYFKQTLFSVPLSMESNTTWRCKTKQVGTTEPGEFLHVRLLLRAI